jgi:hypothetical protein
MQKSSGLSQKTQVSRLDRLLKENPNKCFLHNVDSVPTLCGWTMCCTKQNSSLHNVGKQQN